MKKVARQKSARQKHAPCMTAGFIVLSLLLQDERRSGHVIVVEEVGAALQMRQSPGAESTDKAIHEHVVIAKLLANRAYQNLVRTV